MDNIFKIIMTHLNDLVAVTLFAIGFANLLFQQNMIKKIIGLNIMDTAIYLLLATQGYIEGLEAPILTDYSASASADTFINPIPSGLVLTGIVVSVSVTALMLSMTVRMYREYHTLDLDRILMLVRAASEE